ncbi:MAG: GNAT family N-acetyltransferase, partial [Bacteroidaceae bacterium]
SKDMEYTVIHDNKVNRFEIFESGQIAYLQYEEKEDTIDFVHTFVPKQLEGQGIANALAEAGLNYAKREQLKVIPSCSFIKTYIERHK